MELKRFENNLYTTIILILFIGCGQVQQPTDGWIELFNGKDLSGWTASEHKGTFSVQDGNLVAHGDRSHLFYSGEVAQAIFTDFEFQAEVLTTPGSNSGIFFHTAYQEEGWPFQGYEAQVSNTHVGAGDYRELKKTGSLYAVRNIYKQLVADDEWFRYHIKVLDNRIEISINDILVVDYVPPEPDSLDLIRYKGKGTIAIQGHDPDSKVFYRNIKVRLLENQQDNGHNLAIRNKTYHQIRHLQSQHHSITDLGVVLDEHFNLKPILDFYYRTGINVGIVLDPDQYHRLEDLRKHPVFVGASGSDSKIDLEQFDYVIGDAGAFPVGLTGDEFMEAYVEDIISDLQHNTLSIWTNATRLPDTMAANHQAWWTADRTARIIQAANKYNVAINIDNSKNFPGIEFLKMAKSMGAKFTYSNLGLDTNTGELDYIAKVIEECGMGYKDIFIP